jgi:SAM-dependent methyltransferase
MALNPDALRAELAPLSWPERFDRLKSVEKEVGRDERTVVSGLRTELAAAALEELSPAWNGMPLKEGVLRLPSKRMRGALTRAAKSARDRAIVELMQTRRGNLMGIPPGHRIGIGLDERVVEMPLALDVARLDQPGNVLDAGAALNVPVVRELFAPPVARITHFTLAGSEEPLHDGAPDRVIYEFGDLRALPYHDGHFDRVVCISTLEHVGMDTSRFGATTDRTGPDTAPAAVAELLRVLAPGRRMVVTVPYGRAADHGWFRVLDERGLETLLAPLSGHPVQRRYFYYDRGWFEGDVVPPQAVIDAGYSPDVVTGVAVATLTKGAGS